MSQVYCNSYQNKGLFPSKNIAASPTLVSKQRATNNRVLPMFWTSENLCGDKWWLSGVPRTSVGHQSHSAYFPITSFAWKRYQIITYLGQREATLFYWDKATENPSFLHCSSGWNELQSSFGVIQKLMRHSWVIWSSFEVGLQSRSPFQPIIWVYAKLLWFIWRQCNHQEKRYEFYLLQTLFKKKKKKKWSWAREFQITGVALQ